MCSFSMKKKIILCMNFSHRSCTYVIVRCFKQCFYIEVFGHLFFLCLLKGSVGWLPSDAAIFLHLIFDHRIVIYEISNTWRLSVVYITISGTFLMKQSRKWKFSGKWMDALLCCRCAHVKSILNTMEYNRFRR